MLNNSLMFTQDALFLLKNFTNFLIVNYYFVSKIFAWYMFLQICYHKSLKEKWKKLKFTNSFWSKEAVTLDICVAYIKNV